MSNKGDKCRKYHVINTDESEYNILFHQPTGKIACIPKELVITEQDYKELDKKLALSEVIQVEVKKEFGKGKITLSFMSARTCNLSCSYCFAGEGEYGKYDCKPKQFTYDMYMQGLQLAIKTYPEGLVRIGFFGGEPLINFKDIMRFVPDCIELLKEHQLEIPRISITTNATLLTDEVLDFMKQYNINISVSLDGDQEINDYARKYSSGNISVYKEVYNKCKRMEQKDINYVIQATINCKHIMNFKEGDAINWAKSLEEFDFSNMSIIPVSTEVEGLSLNSEEYLDNLKLFTKELVNYYLEKLQNGIVNKIPSLIVTPMLQLTKKDYVRSCSSGKSFFVDTDGQLYPCHMFCNESDFKIGDLIQGINRGKSEEIANINKSKCNECESCIAQSVCTVWCKGLQYLCNGNVNSICKERCSFQQVIAEESIKYLAKLGKDQNLRKEFWRNYEKYNNELHKAGYQYRGKD